jgi:hypothetical protein
MIEPDQNPELTALAAIQFGSANDGAGALPGSDPGQAAQDEAQATAQLDAAVSNLALGFLRAARSIVARRLPEIRDEWSDDVLRGPADALPPVMKRYAGQLSEWAQRFPDLIAFGVACMPMVMGYVAAVEKNAMTVQDVKARPAAAPPPRPAAPQPGPDGAYRVG